MTYYIITYPGDERTHVYKFASLEEAQRVYIEDECDTVGGVIVAPVDVAPLDQTMKSITRILVKSGTVLLDTANYKFAISGAADKDAFVVIAHDVHATKFGQSVTIYEGTQADCRHYLRKLACAGGALVYSNEQQDFLRLE